MTILSYYRIYLTGGGTQYVWSTTEPIVSLTGGSLLASTTTIVGFINITNTSRPITFAQSPYTAVKTDSMIVCNTAGGAITVNLPNATTFPNKVYYFTNTGTNSVIVTATAGQTIDGTTTSTITATGNRMLAVQSSGGIWTKSIDNTSSGAIITLNSTSNQTNRNLTDPTDIIRCTQLATTGTDVILTAGAQPTIGQALFATSTSAAAFGNIPASIISGIASPAVLYADAANLIKGDAVNFTWNITRKCLGIGINSAFSRLNLAGNITNSSWGNNGVGLRLDAATYTDSSSSGTVASNMVHAILAPTLAAALVVRYSNAATLYVNNAPTAGTNVTLAKRNAFAIGNGDISKNGNIDMTSAASGSIRSINFETNSGAKFQFSSTTADIGRQGGNGYNHQLFAKDGIVISGGRGNTPKPSFQPGSSAAYNCVILNTAPHATNTVSTRNLVLQKSLITPILTDPAGIPSTGDFLQFQTGSGSVGSGSILARVDSLGNYYIPHLIGNSATPTITAGTGVTAVTLTGTDLAGKIAFTTGATTTGNIALVTATFARAYARAPYVIITASSAITANNIAFFYVTQTTTTFTITQTGTLPSATSHSINYRVIG